MSGIGTRPALVRGLKTHVSNMHANLGVKYRVRVVVIAHESGLVNAGSVPAREVP